MVREKEAQEASGQALCEPEERLPLWRVLASIHFQDQSRAIVIL